ncbi:MAG: RCC1 domain-containing protein [Solirubrobacteraceae bacterium]
MGVLTLAGITPPALGSGVSPGQLYAFGDNCHGELGNSVNNCDFETVQPNPTPELVELPGEEGTVTQVARGGGFSLVITSGGGLYAFGDNYFGELGNPINNQDGFAANPTPTLVGLPGEVGPVTQAAGGVNHSLVATASGQLYAFGENWFGQLGDETNNLSEEPNPTPTPVTLPGQAGLIAGLAGGLFHSLVLTSTGQLYAFGKNRWGQLGTATNANSAVPNPTPTLVALPGESGPITQIAAGEQFSLAVTSSGQLYAFGENRYGQLGTPTNNMSEEANPTPTLVTLPGEVGPVVQAAAGPDHSLALTSTGQLYAFGYNYEGQLGNAINNRTGAANPTPRTVTLPGATGRIIRIAAGNEFSLALTSTGQLFGFGSDSLGELGRPPGGEPGAPHPTPTQVALPEHTNAETMATGLSLHNLVVIADLAVSNPSLPAGEMGLPYAAQAQGSGGAPPDTWSAVDLPPGLAIDPVSGAISGIPTIAGSYTPIVTVTDSYGIEAPKTLPIKIQGPEPPPTEPVPQPNPPPPSVPSKTGQPPAVNARPLRPSVQNPRQSARRWRDGHELAHFSRDNTPTGTTISFSLN